MDTLYFWTGSEDLIELESGEKLAPQWIESRLKFSPYIKEAWVLAGPDQAYASAILIINYDTCQKVGRTKEGGLYYLRRAFPEGRRFTSW